MVSTTRFEFEVDRLDFLLGRAPIYLSIPSNQITAEEWLALINRALELIKPKLKYLHGFRPLNDLLDVSHRDQIHRRLQRKDLSYYCSRAAINSRVEGIDRDRTRIVVLGPLWGHGDPENGPQEILLTQVGQWLGVTVGEIQNVVKPLSDQEILALLEWDRQQPFSRMGKAVIASIRDIIKDTVEEMQQRQAAMVLLQESVGSLLRHVGSDR